MLNKFHHFAIAGLSVLVAGFAAYYLIIRKEEDVKTVVTSSSDAKLTEEISTELITKSACFDNDSVSKSQLLEEDNIVTITATSEEINEVTTISEEVNKVTTLSEEVDSVTEKLEEDTPVIKLEEEKPLLVSDEPSSVNVLSSNMSNIEEEKFTIIYEDFILSADPWKNEVEIGVQTEADKSEAYANLARKFVLENESPKRRALRQAREEILQRESEEEGKRLLDVEKERRNVLRTAASQAAAVASVHVLAISRGGGSLRSPLRGASPRRVEESDFTKNSAFYPKKLSDEFATVASPSKAARSVRKQILAEMKRVGHHDNL
jgi:hypothetical protein